VPEGDTIHHAANRIRPLLEGRIPDEIRMPQQRHAIDRWPQRLDGRVVRRVDAYGKHLFLRFEGDLVLHSHLAMTGAWAVYRKGERWRRAPRRAWLVLSSGAHDVVQFDGPTLELLTEQRLRSDPRLSTLGPDILGDELDESQVLRRLRAGDHSRGVGDALLDQRVVAGIGNIWKSESCFAAALDPWRTCAATSDQELLSIVRFAHTHMAVSVREGYSARPRAVYNRGERPCPRCGARIRSAGQGEQNRTTYWCPGCQR
jgi:endonuclease VIII